MQIDYTDMSNVEQTLTVGVAYFTPKETPNTHFAKTDKRTVFEITHYGVEEGFTFKIPLIVESELPSYKLLLAAIRNCNTLTVTDPDNTMPEFDFPIVLVREDNVMPTLLRIPPCKTYTLTVSSIRVE